MPNPFMIAELGASHMGNLARAYSLIEAAADADANAVKVQTWDPDSMVLDPERHLTCGPWVGRKMADLYRAAQLPWDMHEKIFERCKAFGMVGFSTAFDHKALAFLESIGCPMYKIASFEIVDLDLIDAVAGTGKPMLISTGMATAGEIADAYWTANRAGCKNLTLLKCTSAYPAGPWDANLATMRDMATRYECDVGVSDHTLGIGVAVAASALGADVIEKHLTLRRADGGPDAGFSMEPAEFKAMVAACRQAEVAFGAVRYGPTASEEPQVALRRSLHISRDLPAGHELQRSDATTARPADGLPPKFLTSLIGRKLKGPAKRGDPITWDTLQDKWQAQA